MHTGNPDPEGHDLVTPMYRIVQRFVTLRGAPDPTTPLAIYLCKTTGKTLLVVQRFVTLRGAKYQTTPLAIYVCENMGKTLLVTTKEIEASMRRIAAKVYDLDPIKDADALKRWSAHSLRVGVCVIIHCMGFTEPQIQWLLRWKSLAFMTYLRNMVFLGDKQNQALDKAAGIPHFA